MTEVSLPTIDELKHRRRESLQKSEAAILANPGVYRELKKTLRHVMDHPVDVSDYYRTARRLSLMLKTLDAVAPGSVFAYYQNNIDPARHGDARYFKVVCLDLLEQVKRVDQFVRAHHNLRIVK